MTASLLRRGPRLIASLLVFGSIAPASAQKVDHVIHISIDGLRGDLLENLVMNDSRGDFANFRRLQDEGAFTYNARTDFTHTETLPNHTSMLTGRPVLRPDNQLATVHHGYIHNGDPGPDWSLHNTNRRAGYIASTFDVAHDNCLSTSLYASKSKFVIYEQSYNEAAGATDISGEDNGTDKIDVYVNRPSGAGITASFVSGMANNHFNYSFLHILDPDSAGHSRGWESTAWTQSVRDVDGYLGDLFGLLNSDPALRDNTAIVLTSDHGGSGNGHEDPSERSSYTIPFFLWGPGVPAGADLYALMPNRTDPGASRPDYDDPNQPLRNGDSGNLALSLLGLPTIPGSIMRPELVPEPSTLLVATMAIVALMIGPMRRKLRGRR